MEARPAGEGGWGDALGETHAALAPIVRHGREEEEEEEEEEKEGEEEAPPHGPAPPGGRGRALGEGTRGGGGGKGEERRRERRRRRRRRREEAFAPPAPTRNSPERAGPGGGTSPTDSAWVARRATRRASSQRGGLGFRQDEEDQASLCLSLQLLFSILSSLLFLHHQKSPKYSVIELQSHIVSWITTRAHGHMRRGH
ncbi:serine/arginine repetitive matrix protein 3-like isoform X1 [Tyto alba]|uniref:serine/arginine repetitive matrix protein 3-like isoform X1 n=1 Tax=Tyto alba TaxID=56313 RepID=UPI001C676A5A|nr:serine/arginine repetitive matrix protein 3-like isoform X1 [Tyto alba]